MELVCDLEIHSKYARAVSRYMIIPEMAKWAAWKGIEVMGTGDFTHPTWFSELQSELVEDGTGLLCRPGEESSSLRFMLTGEVATIYSQGGKGRRIHVIVVAPSFAVAAALSERLGKHGKLIADGRPMLGLSCKQLLHYVLEVNAQFNLTDDVTAADYTKRPGAFIIPAHVWTPWFGLYGSKSGFDSIEECFEELTPHVRAIETGLSSDLLMNWRLSANDRLALISFSDAHSAANLMREATVVSVQNRTYADLAQALQNPQMQQSGDNAVAYTIEFFPQEGKYHYDGIASQQLRLHPNETAQLRQEKPELAKKVTVGVLSRTSELADRPEGYRPTDRPDCLYLIPLQEIIADMFGVSKQSKRVQRCYESLVEQRSEFDILVRLSEQELEQLAGPEIAQGIMAVRRREVIIEPGYDGIYGTIQIKK